MTIFLHPILSFSACESSFINKVRYELGYLEELNENYNLVACKPLPNSPNQIIVAIARRQEGTEIDDSETMGDYNLDISLVNGKTGKTIIHKFIKQRFTWDGTRFGGIEIDTANYTVSSGLRAFGIRATYHTGGFTSDQTLSLFAVNGKEINEVLSDAVMYIFFENKFSSCLNETRVSTRTVSVDTKKENGFYNLLVTEVLVDSHEESDREKIGECVWKIDNNEIKNYTLHFNGKKYVVPNEMKEFDCHIC